MSSGFSRFCDLIPRVTFISLPVTLPVTLLVTLESPTFVVLVLGS